MFDLCLEPCGWLRNLISSMANIYDILEGWREDCISAGNNLLKVDLGFEIIRRRKPKNERLGKSGFDWFAKNGAYMCGGSGSQNLLRRTGARSGCQPQSR